MNKIPIARNLLFVVVAALYSGCSNTSDKPDLISNAEYEIYTCVIDSLCKPREASFFFIADSTDRNHSGTWRFIRDGKWIDGEFLGLNYPDSLWDKSDHEELAQEYKRKNTTYFQIDRNAIHCNVKLMQITDDSLQKIFRPEKDGWKIFHQAYPNAVGILHVSRVGFNKREDQALVYLDFVGGGLNGVGYYILLYKDATTWRIRKIVEAWAS